MPDPKPKPRRRWLTRLLGALGLAAAAAVICIILAIQNLEWLAKWSIHRLFPGVKAELGSLRITSPTRLEVRELVLKSSKTGEPLLALADGSAVFRFADIWRLRLDELHLRQPNLVVSPDLGDALGVKPAAASGQRKSGGMPGWGIGRLVLTDGHLRITRFGGQSPTVDMDVSADLRDFGVGGDAGQVEHFVRLTRISALDVRNQPVLGIADADLRFTADELFSHDRIRAIRIGKGDLTLGPALLNSFSSAPPKSAAQNGSAKAAAGSGWSVGSLQLDGIAVSIPDAPGFIGRTSFHVAAVLRDIGGTDAAPQSVTLSDLHMVTDRHPRSALLNAARAEARFTIAGLSAGQVDEITLKEPRIDFSQNDIPEDESPPAAAATSTAAKSADTAALGIGRLRCDYGTLRLRDMQGGALDVTAKFAFDLKNFGTAGDAAKAPQEATIWDVQAADGGTDPFATLDVVTARFTGGGLLRQRIDAIEIAGGRLLVGGALQKLVATPDKPAAAPPKPGGAPPSRGWSIGTLDISRVRARIEDKRPGLTELRFTLNTALRNVEAGGATEQVLDAVQTVELTNIDLRSPLNAAQKIFSLRSVFVRFTLRDLARKNVREIVILRPTIYLSQDLFVYMERASAPGKGEAQSPAQPAAAGPNWSVDHLDVKFGRLVIGGGTSSDVGVPIEFETSANHLALDDLTRLQLQTALRVPKQDYENSNYQIAVKDIEGDLRFSYPPDKGEKNLVQKLEMKSARWRQFESTKPWIAVTFDAQGINGQFGGEAYDGYLNGGFSFMFEDDSPWVGWVSGTGLATRQITEIMAPQNFRMTGPLTFEVQFDAFRKAIDRVRGSFKVTEPGTLKVGKLDDLLANIPSEWPLIKQSSTRIALETLRDFDYTAAGGDFWFVQSQGILNLDLKGPNGSRRFEAVLHDGQETDSKWQQGKLGIK